MQCFSKFHKFFVITSLTFNNLSFYVTDIFSNVSNFCSNSSTFCTIDEIRSYHLSLLVFKKDYLFTFRERGRERGREGRKHRCVVFSRSAPHWGPGPGPTHVPGLGLKPGPRVRRPAPSPLSTAAGPGLSFLITGLFLWRSGLSGFAPAGDVSLLGLLFHLPETRQWFPAAWGERPILTLGLSAPARAGSSSPFSALPPPTACASGDCSPPAAGGGSRALPGPSSLPAFLSPA